MKPCIIICLEWETTDNLMVMKPTIGKEIQIIPTGGYRHFTMFNMNRVVVNYIYYPRPENMAI